MSSDEDVAFATIAAVSQAKMRLYSPFLEDASKNSSAIGADAKTLATMLVKEEKSVLCDLRQQLMSVVSRRVYLRCANCCLFRYRYSLGECFSWRIFGTSAQEPTGQRFFQHPVVRLGKTAAAQRPTQQWRRFRQP